MSTLYDLTQQAMMLQEMLELGDIDEETLKDTLDSLEIDTKVENVCKVIRNLEAQAKACKEEEDRISAKRKTAENGVKRLKDLLLFHLSATNQQKVQAGLFKVSKGTSKSVLITDEDKIPVEYRIAQPDKIDKKSIADVLKNGMEVDGAELLINSYVTIR